MLVVVVFCRLFFKKGDAEELSDCKFSARLYPKERRQKETNTKYLFKVQEE